MVAEDIDSCGQAGGVPQAMGNRGPTPCRRQKEKVDVPVDRVLQAQVVQKTVEIPAHSRERPFSDHTETDHDRGNPTSWVTQRQLRSS